VAVIRTALEHDIPVVGICRGHQLLNIAFGGTLHQDLLADRVATAHPDRHRI
jgi:putative glutamine amidotransferase